MRSRQAFLGLGSVNLALLSLYFFPVWGCDAVRALISPYHGLNDRVHATAAIYFRDLAELSFNGLIMTSYFLAGVKLVIAAAFVAYLIEFARAWVIQRQPDRETTDVVLILAAIGVILHAVPALALGEAAMIRLYATQMLLVAGAVTIIVVERQIAAQQQDARVAPVTRLATALRERDALGLGLPAGALDASPPAAPAGLARIAEARLRIG